jgi:hypothetical protein
METPIAQLPCGVVRVAECAVMLCRNDVEVLQVIYAYRDI